MATVNIYDMADTWNDGGTTFTAIKMDVTDTASASGSLLMDLQVGSSSKFSVRKDGLLVLGSSIGTELVLTSPAGASSGGGISMSGQEVAVRRDNNYHVIFNSFGILVSQANDGVSVPTSGFYNFNFDTYLTRKGTANLQLGNADAAGPVAQTLSVQSVVAGTTNTAGQNFTIQGSAGTGSGAGGSIIFQVAPAGTSGTGQNTPQTVFSITGSGNITAPNIARGPSNNDFGIENFSDGYRLGSGASTAPFIPVGGAPTHSIVIRGDGAYAWADGTNTRGTTDTFLYRDAANTLALRNGANAQEFRVYKTTTGTVYKALLGDNNLIKISGEAFTDGAGASTGTLTNAPAAGNPTKWISIDDNGTTRYIPAW